MIAVPGAPTSGCRRRGVRMTRWSNATGVLRPAGLGPGAGPGERPAVARPAAPSDGGLRHGAVGQAVRRTRRYITHLRAFLVEHPWLVLELGVRPVLDPRQPSGFDVERTVPGARSLRHWQQTLAPPILQALLRATVCALPAEIPGLGTTVAVDVTHSSAWVQAEQPERLSSPTASTRLASPAVTPTVGWASSAAATRSGRMGRRPSAPSMSGVTARAWPPPPTRATATWCWPSTPCPSTSTTAPTTTPATARPSRRSVAARPMSPPTPPSTPGTSIRPAPTPAAWPPSPSTRAATRRRRATSAAIRAVGKA